jgi:hypothetical protein
MYRELLIHPSWEALWKRGKVKDRLDYLEGRIYDRATSAADRELYVAERSAILDVKRAVEVGAEEEERQGAGQTRVAWTSTGPSPLPRNFS